VSALRRLQRAAVGTAQWMTRRPITEPVLPRLALSNWTRTLKTRGEVRRRVMVMAFRNQTWIEWAVYAACQLRRLGVATTLVYSSSEIRRLYPIVRLAGVDQLGFWAGVDEIPDVRLVDMDAWLPAPDRAASYRAFAHEHARSVAAYDLHVEENEEGPLASAYLRETAKAETVLADTAAAVERILAVNPVARVVCYSGLIGRSPAVCEAARRHGTDVLTVEGWIWRPGHMICNLNAPALEYNVAGWLQAVGTWDETQAAESDRFMRFQEGELTGLDIAQANVHAAQRDEPLPPHVAAFLERRGPRFLLAPNVVGDSSILRRASPFRSQRDWLRHTIDFFRARPDWNLVVRAHPEESFVKAKVRIRMGDVAREMAGGVPNILVIGGDEDASSYALMPGLAGGLVWISSIGVDMVARGIPVLAAARPKYHELGVVTEPRTATEYFEALNRLGLGRIVSGVRPTSEQQARARQYLNVVFSEFSFGAFSPTYRARDLFLEGPASPPDADVFYRIVAGDLPPETPPRREARRVA
jgi:hypothetical protein